MRDLRTIAVLSGKGGTGKTTLSLNLAVAAQRRGQMALVADADPQRSAALALKTRRRPGPGLVETGGPKLMQLRRAAAREGAELLVIDSAPGPEADVVAAAMAADLCIVVTRPSFLDIATALSTAEIVRRVGGRGLTVLNQAPSAREGREPPLVEKAFEALRFVGLPVCPVVLRARVAFQGAIAHGLGVEEWAPGSAAAGEVAGLWAYVESMMELEGEARRA